MSQVLFARALTRREAAIRQGFRELQQHPDTALSLAYNTNRNLRKTA